MLSRSRTWILLAIFAVITGACLWRVGHLRATNGQMTSRPAAQAVAVNVPGTVSVHSHQLPPIRLLSQPGLLNSLSSTVATQPASQSATNSRFSHRLSNTSQTV